MMKRLKSCAVFKFWTILNTKWNGLWISPLSTNLWLRFEKEWEKIVLALHGCIWIKWINSSLGDKLLSGLDGTVHRSPIAPFLLTKDDESEEGPPTKAKDSAEKKPIKGIEIHMSIPPERAESHWPWQRKATGFRWYRNTFSSSLDMKHVGK